MRAKRSSTDGRSASSSSPASASPSCSCSTRASTSSASGAEAATSLDFSRRRARLLDRLGRLDEFDRLAGVETGGGLVGRRRLAVLVDGQAAVGDIVGRGEPGRLRPAGVGLARTLVLARHDRGRGLTLRPWPGDRHVVVGEHRLAQHLVGGHPGGVELAVLVDRVEGPDQREPWLGRGDGSEVLLVGDRRQLSVVLRRGRPEVVHQPVEVVARRLDGVDDAVAFAAQRRELGACAVTAAGEVGEHPLADGPCLAHHAPPFLAGGLDLHLGLGERLLPAPGHLDRDLVAELRLGASASGPRRRAGGRPRRRPPRGAGRRGPGPCPSPDRRHRAPW